MEVILMDRVEHLGTRGSVINVKPGFARNYLFPKKLAELATPGRLKNLEKEQKADRKRYAKEISAAQEVAKSLASLSVTVKKKVGAKGKLFGSVSADEIAKLVGEQAKIDLDKKQIISDTIKNLGDYKVTIKLLPEVMPEVSLRVIGENGETAESVQAEIEKEKKEQAEAEAAERKAAEQEEAE